MAITYLKKSPKTSSTDDTKTRKIVENILKDIEKTKEEGAKVLLGGKRPAGFNKGFFYEPTVFDDVKDNFTIMKEEPFLSLIHI